MRFRDWPVLKMQHAMFDEQYRIVVADSGNQAAFGVIRRGRGHDLQARNVHEKAV